MGLEGSGKDGGRVAGRGKEKGWEGGMVRERREIV